MEQWHSEAYLRIMKKRRCKKIRNRLITAVVVIAGAVIFTVTFTSRAKETKTEEHVEETEVATAEKKIVPTVMSAEKIIDSEMVLSTASVPSTDWDAEESYLLAKLAMAEAESEDTEGKALVICVVINRVWDDRFPNTIEGVIYQDAAFSSIDDGRFDRVEPDADCWEALEMVQIEHWDGSEGALYFERTPDDESSTWHSRHLEKLFVHGRHTFYIERGETE